MKLKMFSNKYFSNKHTIIFGVLCLFIVVLHAQVRPKQLRKEVLQSQSPKVKPQKAAKKKNVPKTFNAAPLAPTVNPLNKQNATLVYLEKSETLSFDNQMNANMQVLRGDVRFRHDNALLYCDSAYFDQNANSLDAFGNVRMVQGDTLFVYGDYLFYDGNLKLARLRRNVRMINKKTTLTTDSLNYDRITNLAYYYTGGKIVDIENTLTSLWGQYSPATNEALFKKNVHLKNKNFTMQSDTLRYNTKSHIANIVGPTHIIYNNETDIYSKRGWYNTTTEQMMLLDRSTIVHKDGKTMTGDTIFYDKTKKYGEGFTRMILNDSVQKTTLYGNYVYYNEKSEVGMATDSALMVDWSGKDTMYVHADTLYTSKDSIYNVARGYYHVRIFRNDVQGLCDSLAYTSRDSVLHFFGQPVLWAEKNQLSGEVIHAYTKNQTVDKVHIIRNAIAIQQEDSLYFNQLSGKDIIAYMDSGELKKIDVNGNAQTLYYPKDEKDSTLIGLNKTQSSFVVMYLKNRKVDRIVMTAESTGIMYPLKQLSGSDLYLKNFFWLEEHRPKSKKDVFLVLDSKKRDMPGAKNNSTLDASNDASSNDEESAKGSENSEPQKPKARGNANKSGMGMSVDR